MAQTVQDKERELEASQKRCTALLAQTNQIEHSMKVRHTTPPQLLRKP
jgi:hypothetical protein